MDIIVIGAGAAGYAAAITAAERGANVLILERNDRALKKLLTTGNGRCNLGNMKLSEASYHGDVSFVKSALSKIGLKETIAFFQKIGVPLKREGDKLYPYCLQAAAVSDMLRLYAEKIGVRLITGMDVKRIKKGKGFCVETDKDSFYTDRVIVAVGGKAAKQLSGGGAYTLLTNLGHNCTQLRPALVPIKTEGTKALAGTKTEAKITLLYKGKCIAEEKGELLFTDYGLSGPPILQLTASMPSETGCTLQVDLLPEFDEKHLLAILKDRSHLDVPMERYFTGFLKKTIAQLTLKETELKYNDSCKMLTEKDYAAFIKALKHRTYSVQGTAGWQQAQVTSGGISCHDFNEYMESRSVRGLFAAGEVLNVHGNCGGFNLQWAWTSGIIAGRQATE